MTLILSLKMIKLRHIPDCICLVREC